METPKTTEEPRIKKMENLDDFLVEEILEKLNNIPKDENPKTFLIEKLSENYGQILATKIIDSLSKDFFKNEAWINKKETILEKTLENDFNLPKEKIIEIKRSSNWKKVLKIGTFSILSVIAILGITHIPTPTKKERLKDKTKIEKDDNIPNKGREDMPVKKIFDIETYNSLSETGKQVYKYFSENDPTPGRYYGFLDKDSALIYVFGPQNEFIEKIAAGFGKDEGDSPNTSKESDKGNRTTPSGVCLLSNSMDQSDIIYGKLQFTLYGKTISGDIIELGLHQTYLKELESRTKKLATKDPNDNRFSDGCINADSNDFKRYIKANFRGDYGELFFTLPDKKSREGDTQYDVNILVQSIAPMIIQMSNEEIGLFSERLSSIKILISENLKESERLEKEYNKLTSEYKKDPKNISKQKDIENIKNKIKELKNQTGTLRGAVSNYEKNMKESIIKRDGAQEILLNH